MIQGGEEKCPHGCGVTRQELYDGGLLGNHNCPNAPYKLLQRERAPHTLLASSDELRDYQKAKGTSALRIARLAKEKLGQS